jgi:hypothetical protein
MVGDIISERWAELSRNGWAASFRNHGRLAPESALFLDVFHQDRAGAWRITQDEYDKKARELKERQAEIATCIDQHQQGDGEYRTTLESLISLASRAAELFERSKTEQKRQLLAFVFSNLRLRGKKLQRVPIIVVRSPNV